MDINFNAPVRIIKEILPQMMENDNGHIVNIASVLGYIGCCGISDYCASKSALVGFEESVRFELFKANSNVKMTSICPYLINTQLFEGVQPKKWFEILVPKLDQKYVAQRILYAIRQNERVVILPYIMYIILAIKPLLPSWLHEIIQDLSGSNEVMDHLKIKKKQ
ncbi:hypothetical protein PPERSA_11145 [Pseudocohnilembus persalinus]|uniref:NAD(P)-binding domain n=1 Tax=Pseudocohnilembus persalinus TaxID=266149 RepID=A0A0V0QZ51_PSEPJ|nr:hypothetical protein PPERSA_11145 [Pseudocohnilembus persalinus]|eukprot:KRX07596.1 hypothetical protein PPERSA_11145 [Pseudocohnilembus persalinus]